MNAQPLRTTTLFRPQQTGVLPGAVTTAQTGIDISSMMNMMLMMMMLIMPMKMMMGSFGSEETKEPKKLAAA